MSEREQSALRSLDFAKNRKAELAKLIRERLLAGYDPAGCMAEVTIEVRYKVTRRQCHGGVQDLRAFDGIVGFCSAHYPQVAAVLDAVKEAEAHLAGAREFDRHAARAAERAEAREPMEPGVYVLYDAARSLAKIGCTTNKDARLGSVRAAVGTPLELLHWAPTEGMFELERHLHRHFAAFRLTKRGEWFSVQDVADFIAECEKAISAFAEGGA